MKVKISKKSRFNYNYSFSGEINKNISVELPIYNIQRNPVYWKECDRFRPDRFITDKIVNNSFIPFSVSPRKCLGEKFALDALRTIIFFILKNYRIELKQNTVIKYNQSPLILQFERLPFSLSLK